MHHGKMSQRILITVLFTFISTSVQAIPFGTFDPRSLAMGGTGVASATTANASYYNPALLAQYKQSKEKGRNSTFAFPIFGASVSNTLEELDDFQNQNLDAALTTAISTYNGAINNTNAQAVANATQALRSGLNSIASDPLLLSANAGLVIGIPSAWEGGAFMINVRAVGDGNVNLSTEDDQLLADYIEAMDFITSGSGNEHLELFSGGNLIDPVDNLTSTAQASGALIAEVGVSFSGTVELAGTKFSLGATPKMVQVKAYDYAANATDDTFDKNKMANNKWDFNIDVGMAKALGPKWRAGLVIKNLIPNDYATGLNNKIKIRPQIRAGVLRRMPWGLVTMDVDIMENDPVGAGKKSQFVLLGAEWDVSWSRLRAGYNHDFKTDASQQGILSAGIGFTFYNSYLDAAYADNGIARAAGLQYGFYF